MHADETQEIHRFLSAGEWFGGLPGALQGLILDRSVVRKYAKGQVISLEGCGSKGLFAVLDGMVHAVRQVGDGEESLMHVCEPGFWFAEYALLSGKATLITFLAQTPAKMLQLPKAHFDRIVAEEPRYYEPFARLALDRYADLVRVFAEVRDLAPEARLRGRLAVMAQMRMKERPLTGAVSLAVSQADLARMIGVSRQTLNALLSKLHQTGLIEVGFRCIRVLDAACLVDPDAEAVAVPEVETARSGFSRAPLRASREHID